MTGNCHVRFRRGNGADRSLTYLVASEMEQCLGRIFISHRSADFAESVAPLYTRLVAAYGKANVVLDKTHFVPGEDWLPQILSSVAISDVLILALGPSWITRSTRTSGTDYLIEELQLAKKLRKPIIPVLLGVTPDEVRASLPQDLAWITHLQFLPSSPDDGALQGALLTHGVQTKSHAVSRRLDFTTIFTASTARRAAGNLVSSCLFPISCAAMSLQPEGSHLRESLLEAVYVSALMWISTLLATGRLDAYMAARLTMGVVVGSVLIFVLVQLLTILTKRRPSVASLFSHSLHTASATAFVFVIWMTAYWVVLPDDIQVELSLMFSMPPLSTDILVQLFNRISTVNKVVLAIIGYGVNLHAAYVIRGSFIAGVVVLGWRRWQAVSIIAITLISLLLAWSAFTKFDFK